MQPQLHRLMNRKCPETSYSFTNWSIVYQVYYASVIYGHRSDQYRTLPVFIQKSKRPLNYIFTSPVPQSPITHPPVYLRSFWVERKGGKPAARWGKWHKDGPGQWGIGAQIQEGFPCSAAGRRNRSRSWQCSRRRHKRNGVCNKAVWLICLISGTVHGRIHIFLPSYGSIIVTRISSG